MVAFDVTHFHLFDARKNLAAHHGKSIGRIVKQLVAAPLRLQGKRETGVAGNQDGRYMVHLHGNVERHEILRLRILWKQGCIVLAA